MIRCVKAKKIGDSLLRDEDGSLISILPDTFYDVDDRWGYWQLLKYPYTYKILRVLYV